MTESAVALPVIHEGMSPAAEAFRALRNTIRFQAEEHGQKSLLVTSAGPQEGKSVVSANLAAALAQMELRVTLIDANLRSPALHTALGVPQEPGLADCLNDEADSPAFHEDCGTEGLRFLAAGAIPDHAPELLASGRMTDLISTIGQDCDHIILDTPPLLVAADAAALTRCVDGVLFVVRANQARRDHIQRAKAMLNQIDAHVLGVVFNDDPNAKKSLAG
jgi:capsular exopolysaccharide synthesis family protein